MYKYLYYPESQYGGFADIDGTIAFYMRINSLISPQSVILDFGCGRGEYVDDDVLVRRQLRIFQGKCSKVIGLDVDPVAAKNPYIDEFHILNSGTWPVTDDCIDLIICDNVLEHLEKPDVFFTEAARVLCNRGLLCIRTPNAWNYIALVSRFIPNKFHHTILSRVQKTRKDEDVFHTFYRCNSIPRIRAILRKSNFDSVVYGYEAEPVYLNFSKYAYLFGWLHQKFSPNMMRAAIFVFARINKSLEK